MCATHGEQKLPYAWLELEFGENALIALATASDSSFPESFIDTVEQVRTLDASNVFGEGDISCIRIPSRKSYEAQLEQAIAKKAQEDEEAAAGGEDVAAGGEEAPEQDVAGEGEAAGGEEMAQTAANAAAQAAEGEPAFTWPELPAFDVDYSIWGIEFTNGEVCEFNSETNSFEE